MNKVESSSCIIKVFYNPKINTFFKILSALAAIAALGLLFASIGLGWPITFTIVFLTTGALGGVVFGLLFCCKPNEGVFFLNKTPRNQDELRQQLIAFLTQEDGQDCEGRTFNSIFGNGGKTNQWLEKRHDYIQWAFPSCDPSESNVNAPILDAKTLNTLRKSSVAQKRVLKAFDTMLSFYGLKRNKSDGRSTNIAKASVWEERRRVWITPNNHNYRRISRILQCLSLMGQGDLAQAFYDQLVLIQKNEEKIATTTHKRPCLTKSTLKRWEEARNLTNLPDEFVEIIRQSDENS